MIKYILITHFIKEIKKLKIFENLFNINSKYEFYNSEIIKIDKLKDLISEKN